jgi:hypothetical protein
MRSRQHSNGSVLQLLSGYKRSCPCDCKTEFGGNSKLFPHIIIYCFCKHTCMHLYCFVSIRACIVLHCKLTCMHALFCKHTCMHFMCHLLKAKLGTDNRSMETD